MKMKKHLPYILIVAAALLLDQVTKYIIEANLSLEASIEVIPGFFRLLYVRNTGAAWSLFAGSGMTFFYVITIVALIVLFLFYRACEERDVWSPGQSDRPPVLSVCARFSVVQFLRL